MCAINVPIQHRSPHRETDLNQNIINKQRMTTYTRNGRRGTMINDNLEMKTTTLMGISLKMLTQLATCTLTSSASPCPQPQPLPIHHSNRIYERMFEWV